MGRASTSRLTVGGLYPTYEGSGQETILGEKGQEGMCYFQVLPSQAVGMSR